MSKSHPATAEADAMVDTVRCFVTHLRHTTRLAVLMQALGEEIAAAPCQVQGKRELIALAVNAMTNCVAAAEIGLGEGVTQQ